MQPIDHLAWLAVLERGAALLRNGSLHDVAPLLPSLLDSDLREDALAFVAHLDGAVTDLAGVAVARAALDPSDADRVIAWFLRARALADPADRPLHARIARDLGARYLASAQPAAADAILRSTRGLLGVAADDSADLLQLDALIADFSDDQEHAAHLNQRSLEVAHHALTPMTHAIALVNLAAAREASDPRSSASLACLALQMIASDRLHCRAESAARNVHGYVLLPLGDLDGARAELVLSAFVAQRTSYARVAAFAQFNLAIHAELDGRPQSAAAQLDALLPSAREHQFEDLSGWLRVRQCWLAAREDRPADEVERRVSEVEAVVTTRRQRDALRVIRLLADLAHGRTSFDELIAAALARDDKLEAFALGLQAASREHGVGRLRRARRLARDATTMARELGFRAAPNWWSVEAARVACIYEPDFGRLLIGGHDAARHAVMRPHRAAVTVDDVPDEVWREGRTGARVLRRLFAILVEAHPRGIDRDALCDALWPDTDGDKAVRNLYAAIDDLRRALRAVSGIGVANEAGKYRLMLTQRN